MTTITSAPAIPGDLQPVPYYTARYPWLDGMTLRAWIREGRLRAYRPGGRWLVAESDFNALVLAGQNDVTP